MSLLLNVTIGIAVFIASMIIPTSAQMACAQGITPSDVEQQVRASLSVWDTGDSSKIMEIPGPGGNYGGFGFGYRTKASRAMSLEEEKEIIDRFLASVEYYRITEDEMQTAVDGDIGLAWGIFTEEFHVRGRTPEKVSVRFTVVLKKEAGSWRQLLFHRDTQPFDDDGSYILSLTNN